MEDHIPFAGIAQAPLWVFINYFSVVVGLAISVYGSPRIFRYYSTSACEREK